ncbi:MAG: VOC family protein [Candidatus Eremiobacteraeota bacterium]|nr:VOC family protein [Candidatus Eremiobacteraeota bacterium]MBV9648457.1 VOC family protein [Candidatus Eremiobacteraeota bacterium]
MGRVVPVLRIFDKEKALEFYRDFLGFEVNWEHRFEPKLPVYMQLSRDGATLHLSEHHGDGSPGAHVRIETSGLTEYRAALLAKAYPYARPGVQKQPWGERSMTINDPFGNRVTFYERIS